jgi:hypothetical protein
MNVDSLTIRIKEYDHQGLPVEHSLRVTRGCFSLEDSVLAMECFLKAHYPAMDGQRLDYSPTEGFREAPEPA